MSNTDKSLGGMASYRFALPNPVEPLPITSLVQRTLAFACLHFTILNVPLVGLQLLLKQIKLKMAPSMSFRKGDAVDRYDLNGLFLYVRTETVILIAGNRMVYASTETGTVSISNLTPFSLQYRHREGVLVEEGL